MGIYKSIHISIIVYGIGFLNYLTLNSSNLCIHNGSIHTNVDKVIVGIKVNISADELLRAHNIYRNLVLMIGKLAYKIINQPLGFIEDNIRVVLCTVIKTDTVNLFNNIYCFKLRTI